MAKTSDLKDLKLCLHQSSAASKALDWGELGATFYGTALGAAEIEPWIVWCSMVNRVCSLWVLGAMLAVCAMLDVQYCAGSSRE